MIRLVVATVVAVLLGAACGPEVPTFDVGDPEFRGPRGSGGPSLHATGDGRVILTWMEPTGPGRHALRVAQRHGGGWSTPQTVSESELFFVNWADFPSLTELANGTWLVHWLEKTAPNTYAYHVKLALSADHGFTWSDPIVPHRDLSPREHGFVSMVPWGASAAQLVWLDGRKMTSADGAVERGTLDPGEMSLRATTIDANGTLGPDVLLDDRTCECCQTALARTRRGLIAAYRDRSAAEIRNVAVVRQVGDAWSEPADVHDDGWYYPGCPVNGPQLAAWGDTVAVAWFTAPAQRARTNVAFSVDGGSSFRAPIRVDDGEPVGRVDVVMLDDGRALVVWLERTPVAAEIRGRVVQLDGRTGKSWVVAETSDARASGFPRVARSGDEVVVAWTLVGEEGGVRVATAKIVE